MRLVQETESRHVRKVQPYAGVTWKFRDQIRAQLFVGEFIRKSGRVDNIYVSMTIYP
jgi:hypothetical protein